MPQNDGSYWKLAGATPAVGAKMAVRAVLVR